MYSKFAWGDLAAALAQAEKGDGSGIRRLVDEDFYARDPETGEFDPINDRYFLLTAIEQRYRKGDVRSYLEAGEDCWSVFEHAYFNCGYVELNYGLFPIGAQDVFRGPFRVPRSATTYRGGLKLARDLGNARTLVMRGDGHTAYGNGSPDCIDPAVENYLINRVLPPAGTRCRQEVPFTKPEEEAAARQRSAQPRIRQVRPHVRPIVR